MAGAVDDGVEVVDEGGLGGALEVEAELGLQLPDDERPCVRDRSLPPKTTNLRENSG